jgi:hemolysin activation/secretion protein
MEVDDSVEFILGSIRIEGATVFSEAELLEPYKERLNKKISFGALQAIPAELTKKYRDGGYLLSRVVLPPQSVDQEAAHVVLVAVEGYISSIQYEGDEALIARFKERFSPVERKLLAKRPLRHAAFERELLLLQDMPGIKVSSRFQEAEVESGSVLVLVLEGEPVSGNLGWGNSGTESAGPGLISAGFELNSLPALGMRTYLSYSQADNIKEYYAWTIGEYFQFSNGLNISASFSRSDSQEPDSEFARLFDYQTDSKTFSIAAGYPLIRTRDLNLSLGIGYEHRDSHSNMAGASFNSDRLRTLSYNVNFDFSDELGGVTQLNTTISQGLNVFKATDFEPFSSNSLAAAEYFKADFYLSRNQRLPFGFGLRLSGEAMFSDRVLASYNKFSFGGGLFGRGYDSGTLEGDKAVAASLEPYWTHGFNDRFTLQPFAFVDYGRVWSNVSLFGIPDSEFGASLGAGFRFWGIVGLNDKPSFSLSAFVGKPLKTIDDENSARFVCQLTFIY